MTDQISQETADPGVIHHVLDANPELSAIHAYAFGWHEPSEVGEKSVRNLNEDVVRNISALKDEPAWMLNTRLKGVRYFDRNPMPTLGADLSGIDFDKIKSRVRSSDSQASS